MQLTNNFSLNEFACKDNTPVPYELKSKVQALAKQLQILRDYLNEPIHINSGYRTPAYNKKIGGKPNSYHIKAMAADITVKSKTPKQLALVIEKLISNGTLKIGGIGVYPGFVHVDTRKVKARW
jgi:uncharacterized protein YcbK (DUF882 family)